MEGRSKDRVEGSELGIAYVRLDGLEGVYGGEARLASSLLHAVPDYLSPRVGLADAKFPAYVAAHASSHFGAFRVPDDVGGFLAPYSIDLLPISSEMKAAMHRFGLHNMGDVGSMREELLADQFGPSGRKVRQLSCGIDETPLVPMSFEDAIVEGTSFPFTSTSMQLISTAEETLLQRAYSRPQVKGRYAGRAELRCALFRSPPWEKVVHFREPIGGWERAAFIIRGRMETDHPQAPVEDMTLTLADLRGEYGTQMGLLPDIKADRERRLAEVEKQLQARMNGKHALYRTVEIAPWHPAPEMRALQVPIVASGRDRMKPLSVPSTVAVQEGPNRQPKAVRLGRRWHQVAVEDLWCFDLWWMHEPLTRTYYLVRREDGRQVTLFRDQRGNCWYQQGS